MTKAKMPDPVAWLYEDELPDNYPYEVMFAYSRVDGVRMFPVYAPQPTEQAEAYADVGLREALEMMVEMVEMNGFGRDYAMDVARTALQSQTVIDDDYLSIVLDVYDNAMQKAFDGREFKNPCMPETPEYKAWEKGIKEGKKKRDAGLPHSMAMQSLHRGNAVRAAINKLSDMTPRPPNAVTYDQGWKIIDVVQGELCPAIDHARRIEEEGE